MLSNAPGLNAAKSYVFKNSNLIIITPFLGQLNVAFVNLFEDAKIMSVKGV